MKNFFFTLLRHLPLRELGGFLLLSFAFIEVAYGQALPPL
jgi:hypothetical protein